MIKLIINADDFGKSKEINLAIMEAMDLNLCKDTTLLVNFEDSLHAAELAIQKNSKNNVGVHLNLAEGYPLTDDIKKEKLFCNDDGLFHYKKDKRILRLTTSEKKAIYIELRSQINLCRKYGIPISHADSHGHIHEEPGMLKIIMNIVKQEKIPFLRIAQNLAKSSSYKALYRNFCNSYISLNNLAASKYFGSTSDYYIAKDRLKPNSVVELMIHPGTIIDNQIYDVYSKENLSAQLPKILRDNNLTSYRMLKLKYF